MRVDLSHNKHIGKIMDVAQTLPRDGDRTSPRRGSATVSLSSRTRVCSLLTDTHAHDAISGTMLRDGTYSSQRYATHPTQPQQHGTTVPRDTLPLLAATCGSMNDAIAARRHSARHTAAHTTPQRTTVQRAHHALHATDSRALAQLNNKTR
jgi:hypothetical protein